MKTAIALLVMMVGVGQAQKMKQHALPCKKNEVVIFWINGADHCEPAKDWATIVAAYGHLTETQYKAFPGNAWMKPCGKDNHAEIGATCLILSPLPRSQ